MKSEVYRKKVDTRDELLVNILDVIACIKERQDALRRTTHHVFTRVAKCIDVDGRIFEHFRTFLCWAVLGVCVLCPNPTAFFF